MFGWKSLFISGGAAAIVGAAVLFAMLPESVRFLTSGRAGIPGVIAATLRRVTGGRTFPAGATFVVSDEEAGRRTQAFAAVPGELRVITPLIWVAYIASSFAVFFIVNWTPLVFESLHYTRAEANNAAGLKLTAGRNFGGLLLMRFTDKRAHRHHAWVALITFVLLLVAGLGAFEVTTCFRRDGRGGSEGSLIGEHFGMHSVCGIFYPSAYRATGASWATSVAKIGSIMRGQRWEA